MDLSSHGAIDVPWRCGVLLLRLRPNLPLCILAPSGGTAANYSRPLVHGSHDS